MQGIDAAGAKPQLLERTRRGRGAFVEAARFADRVGARQAHEVERADRVGVGVIPGALVG